MISKFRPQLWTRWSRRHGPSRAATAPASWALVLAAASSRSSTVPRPRLSRPPSAGPCSFARRRTAHSWRRQSGAIERLPVLAHAPTLSGRPRAELVGGGLDAARRGRSGGTDHRSKLRMETDRGATPAVRARGTPVRLVSHGVPSPRPFGSRRPANWGRVPGHERVAQRQAPRVALRVLRPVRFRPHALPDT